MPSAHPEFTVSSLTSALKRAIESGFSKVVVEGEVSGWKRYPSGHCYFTLKDEGAQISAVMFAGQYESSCKRHSELAAGLKDGAKIKVFGNVTVYPPRGNYQIVVLSATLAGLGDLMQKYLELKPTASNANGITFTVAALYQGQKNNAKALEYYKKVQNDPKFGAQAKQMIAALNK